MSNRYLFDIFVYYFIGCVLYNKYRFTITATNLTYKPCRNVHSQFKINKNNLTITSAYIVCCMQFILRTKVYSKLYNNSNYNG